MLQSVVPVSPNRAPQPSVDDSSLLLELQVPFRRVDGKLLVEPQALNGLRCWSDHFHRLTVCAPVQPEDLPDSSTVKWADPSSLLQSRDIRLEPLPWGYHPREHLRQLSAVRTRFRTLIASHRYLCFSNVGGFGAWGSIAASECRRMHRPYSLWFDWVIHEMTANDQASGEPVSLKRRLKQTAERALATFETQRAIRGCELGLFHGKTVYEAYAPLCRTPAVVHDVHVKPEDAIDDLELARKLNAQQKRDTLRIGYAGRAHPMKDPLAWVETVIRVARALGPARVQATWVGDGPLLEQMKARVCEAGLEGSVHFPGFLSDRKALLSFLREQDVFLFCHVTPESPRCLLESVISGTPLVGYESEYARDIVGARGGAELVPTHDVEGLATKLIELADKRDRLRLLTRKAAKSRALYNDAAVFAHRAELIKRHLP